ncbi:DNA polymerase III subunit delta [Capilliphycus salinus ALCB114379]|uniref:DNA polymerase III subunit delta n=1 Tax=Capilliphycus salinus TaxID=2768948 RepID=UPI0039A4656F
MPVYLYWGDDEFSLAKAVDALRESILDPSWSTFNFDKIMPDSPNPVISGLNQAMTPPFGLGNRLVWLVNTPVTQQCSQELYQELERTLPVIPETTTLLLTTANKPDGRLKSTKLLQQHATVKEFSRIPPWNTDQLEQRVKQVAREVGVNLSLPGVQRIAEAVGNDTQQLYSELEKLKLYAGNDPKPLKLEAIASLVQSNTQNSLKLASAIKAGNTHQALELIAALIDHNEPSLRIVATLVGQFRTWLWVKLMIDRQVKDEREIAKAAEINNPKRIYYLRQEVQSLSVQQLQRTLPLLLELETQLKRGSDQISTLQTHVIALCNLFQSSHPRRG